MEVQQPAASPQVTQPGSAIESAVDATNPPVETPAAIEPVDPATPAEGVEPEGVETPEEPQTNEAEERLKAQEEDFSRRFAALTRRERDFLARESEVKKEREELSSVREKLDNIKKDPMGVLALGGWDMQSLADFVLNNNQVPADKAANDRIAQLEAQINELKEGREKEQLTAKEQQEQEQIAQFKTNIKTEVESNLDKFELINVNEAFDMVYDVIESHFQQTFDETTGQGQILDIKVAAEAVEKHLEEQADTFFKAKKFASRLRPQEPEPQEPIGEPTDKPQSAPTLTHRQTASVTAPQQPEQYMSDEESKAAAARFLEKQWATQ